MIKLQVCGKTIKLEDRDWENLMQRFNPANAKFNEVSRRYNIKIRCSLCLKYRSGRDEVDYCLSCPFNVFAEVEDDRTDGCIRLINRLLRFNLHFSLSMSTVYWYFYQRREAVKQLKGLIHKLEKAVKVKE